jgi:hypothetical protein
MPGQRLKRADAEVANTPYGDVIDVSAFKPRRIPPFCGSGCAPNHKMAGC